MRISVNGSVLVFFYLAFSKTVFLLTLFKNYTQINKNRFI